jgi:hypothetical protein
VQFEKKQNHTMIRLPPENCPTKGIHSRGLTFADPCCGVLKVRADSRSKGVGNFFPGAPAPS